MKVQKKELEQKNLISRGKASKASAMDKAIKDEHNNVKKCKYVVDFMTKGLFFSELARFDKEKVQMFRDMMGTFSAAHIAYSHKLHRMWNGYITTMGLDLREMGIKAKESLGSVEASLTAEGGDLPPGGGAV